MEDGLKVTMGKKASNTALIVNILLMASKVMIGILSKSTAIIADAFNNGTDIFASAAVYGGLRVAYRPPDEKHQYGHAKAEPIVAKIVALIVMVTGGTIGYNSVEQILRGQAGTPGSAAILISMISIFTKFFLYRYIYKVGKSIESSSLIADSYNHRSDVLASSAVLIGVAGARTGFPILDPAAGIIVAVIIFKTGISIYIEAIEALMDTAPPREVIEKIKEKARNTEGVIMVNGVRARKHGPKLHIDLKICVNKDISVEMGHKIAYSAKRNIINEIKGVQDVMIHVNPCALIDNTKKPDCEKCLYKKSLREDENYSDSVLNIVP